MREGKDVEVAPNLDDVIASYHVNDMAPMARKHHKSLAGRLSDMSSDLSAEQGRSTPSANKKRAKNRFNYYYSCSNVNRLSNGRVKLNDALARLREASSGTGLVNQLEQNHFVWCEKRLFHNEGNSKSKSDRQIRIQQEILHKNQFPAIVCNRVRSNFLNKRLLRCLLPD
ncbi:hypothetical protein TcasGA2_TC008373 [Tribolium castaneum]|uniref:Uncharacterized protein n=1 Tax=Tribolium castaneum TaxID=7070 RepID=D2A1D1_TRICA|nr:hypothetical protein TcasGA2_TC008373 [Tribolium castaneum]